jgi:hypothetical protein
MEGDLPEVIDLSKIEPVSFEVTPRGLYEGYVESVEYGLSQNSNLPMLTWILKYDYEEKERTIRWWTTLAGDGAGRTVAALQRLDPELDMENFRPDDADEIFGGLEVLIRITVGPDRQDRRIKRNNVAEVLPRDEE